MKIPGLFVALFIVASLPFVGTAEYCVRATPAEQKEPAVRVKESTQFHYVCPMHDDVTSSARGKCPKCKMVLVKKRIPKKGGKNPVAGVQHTH